QHPTRLGHRHMSPLQPSTRYNSTLSLHDALPISCPAPMPAAIIANLALGDRSPALAGDPVAFGFGSHDGDSNAGSATLAQGRLRSEEHTSELQSRENLECRLLPEKKKRPNNHPD